MKILVFGHGRRDLRNGFEPRCAPMELDEWDRLITNNACNVTFIDVMKEQEPDILENVGNDWSKFIEPGSYNYVIDAISHLPLYAHLSVYYWRGVLHALKEKGMYIGWRNRVKVSLNKQGVLDYMQEIKEKLIIPKMSFTVEHAVGSIKGSSCAC